MASTLEHFVDDIPPKGRKWLLVGCLLLFLLLLNTAYRTAWPPKLIEPIQAQITGVGKRVTTLEQRFDKSERFMCYQDRKSATLAGLDCPRLTGRD